MSIFSLISNCVLSKIKLCKLLNFIYDSSVIWLFVTFNDADFD